MKLSKTKTVLYWLLPVLLIVAIACGDSGNVRKYKEKNPPAEKAQETMPGSGAMGTVPAHGTATMPPHSHFQWDTPAGWVEKRETSGFRIASFSVKTGDKETICTIIPLQGEAGGLKANVSRWLGQITNSMEPDDATVEKLLASQDKFLTKGQFPAVLIDLTTVTPNPTDNSILATIANIQGNSVFIKMSGEKSILSENKEKFKSLCMSLRFATPQGQQ